MSDQTVETPTEAEPEREVTADDMISRGKGLSPQSVAELPDDSPARRAFEEFKALVSRRNDAVALGEELTEERNQEVYKLKNEHNIGFTAMAEVLDVSSSMVLYIHERAQGKTAKQIREESVRSRLAKEQFLEKGEGKTARKQSPEEKALRKKLREELKSFLEKERAAGNADIEDDEVAPEPDDGDDDT